jgi:uncharacterized protein
MGFMGVDIKPSTAVIFTIALGIAVDDSIHYLARFRIEYLRQRSYIPGPHNHHGPHRTRHHCNEPDSDRRFRHPDHQRLHLHCDDGNPGNCATIFGALIADLFILPALFYWLKPKLRI